MDKIVKKMEDDALKNIVKPIEKTIDLEAIKREKGYKGVNRKRFDRLVKELNITEPLEDLLAQLD
jgi:hypothetical protein